MRNEEERIRLICKRTRELKKEQQRKRERLFDGICMAGCLVLVIAMGIWMPELSKGSIQIAVSHTSGAASILGGHGAIGYILMGLLSFALGVSVTILLFRLRRAMERKHREEEADEL